MFSNAKVTLIAEAGVNHDGSEERARELIDIAADAGADAVKFQLFDPQALTTAKAPTADYQSRNLKNNSVSQRDMLAKLALPREAFVRLDAHCRKRHIAFLCTPFDHGSLEYLVKNTKLHHLKLASGEVTNGPLLLAAARTGLPIILSTGMSDMEEIATALGIFHYGYTQATGFPKLAKLTASELKALRDKVTLLHCVSQYPAPIEATNLRAMDAMREVFGLPVGLSDHGLGIAIAIAAAARGASMIEKHFTYDKNAIGPDHKASLSPEELKAMVAAIRDIEKGLGDGEKKCRPEEENTCQVARRSVVAAANIAQGAPFTEANLTCKRPASGLAPNKLWELLGKHARRVYAADDFIHADELK